jgi:hypothetical protein
MFVGRKEALSEFLKVGGWAHVFKVDANLAIARNCI